MQEGNDGFVDGHFCLGETGLNIMPDSGWQAIAAVQHLPLITHKAASPRGNRSSGRIQCGYALLQ
jgi:hypothetical protein